jgi:hypothetical protein
MAAVNDGSTIGALAVPLVAPANSSSTVSDPALDIVLGFIAAVLKSYAATAWASVAPGEPIVRRAFTHDPEDYDFSEGDLPALYMFRTGSANPPEDQSDDLRQHTDSVRLFWIVPRCEPDQERRRVPFFPALGKLIDLKIQQTRDPAYVLASDTDPAKTAQGTVVMRAAGLDWIRFLKWDKTTVAIKMGDGLQSRTYQALDVKLQFQEQITVRYNNLTNATQADASFAIAGAVDSSGNPLPAVPFAPFSSS